MFDLTGFDFSHMCMLLLIPAILQGWLCMWSQRRGGHLPGGAGCLLLPVLFLVLTVYSALSWELGLPYPDLFTHHGLLDSGDSSYGVLIFGHQFLGGVLGGLVGAGIRKRRARAGSR